MRTRPEVLCTGTEIVLCSRTQSLLCSRAEVLCPGSEIVLCSRSQGLLCSRSEEVLCSGSEVLCTGSEDLLCSGSEEVLCSRTEDLLRSRAEDLLCPRAQDVLCSRTVLLQHFLLRSVRQEAVPPEPVQEALRMRMQPRSSFAEAASSEAESVQEEPLLLRSDHLLWCLSLIELTPSGDLPKTTDGVTSMQL